MLKKALHNRRRGLIPEQTVKSLPQTETTTPSPEQPISMDGKIIQLADQLYILPAISVIESFDIEPGNIKKVTAKAEVYCLPNEYVPLIRLYELFNLPAYSDGQLLIVESEGQKFGLLVDELLVQQLVKIQSLETHYRKVRGSGCRRSG